MEIKTENLMTFQHYADKVGFSRMWIDKLAKNGKLNYVVIDGFKFVLLK